jgi:hypothetical protein
MSRHAFVSYSRTDSDYVEQLIAWFSEAAQVLAGWADFDGWASPLEWEQLRFS